MKSSKREFNSHTQCQSSYPPRPSVFLRLQLGRWRGPTGVPVFMEPLTGAATSITIPGGATGASASASCGRPRRLSRSEGGRGTSASGPSPETDRRVLAGVSAPSEVSEDPDVVVGTPSFFILPCEVSQRGGRRPVALPPYPPREATLRRAVKARHGGARAHLCTRSSPPRTRLDIDRPKGRETSIKNPGSDPNLNPFKNGCTCAYCLSSNNSGDLLGGKFQDSLSVQPLLTN